MGATPAGTIPPRCTARTITLILPGGRIRHRCVTRRQRADSLIDSGGLEGSGQEGPVPFLGELLPKVSIPAWRVVDPRREGLKEVIEALVLPLMSPAEVVLAQFSDEGDQLVSAKDLIVWSKWHGVKVLPASERLPTFDDQQEHQPMGSPRCTLPQSSISDVFPGWVA